MQCSHVLKCRDLDRMSETDIINDIDSNYDGPQENVINIIAKLYLDTTRNCNNHVTLVTVYKHYRYSNDKMFQRWKLVAEQFYIWYEWKCPVPRGLLVYGHVMANVHMLHYNRNTSVDTTLYMCDKLQNYYIELYMDIDLHVECIGFIREFNENFKPAHKDEYSTQSIGAGSIAIYERYCDIIPYEIIKYNEKYTLVLIVGLLTLIHGDKFISYIESKRIK